MKSRRGMLMDTMINKSRPHGQTRGVHLNPPFVNPTALSRTFVFQLGPISSKEKKYISNVHSKRTHEHLPFKRTHLSRLTDKQLHLPCFQFHFLYLSRPPPPARSYSESTLSAFVHTSSYSSSYPQGHLQTLSLLLVEKWEMRKTGRGNCRTLCSRSLGRHRV